LLLAFSLLRSLLDTYCPRLPYTLCSFDTLCIHTFAYFDYALPCMIPLHVPSLDQISCAKTHGLFLNPIWRQVFFLFHQNIYDTPSSLTIIYSLHPKILAIFVSPNKFIMKCLIYKHI
jgi:hypothetical protein